MPTLSAMFRLMDGYSSQINKFIGKVDSAATAVVKASKGTDTYNESLGRTGAAAQVASSGLTKLIGTVATLATAKKVMDLTDTYTNTAARLRMVNDGLQTQEELQKKVLAAANRSRGNYTDMAGAVAKMNLLAGDSFTTNDEAIGFTELLQKSLKVSGAGTSEQQSAFLQLTQAMAAGKLQGDEFRSVMENAPMVAEAIAEYMGKTKGELKKMSSQGLITSEIIKNALFDAAEEINNKFNSMPMTFADVWNRIRNAGTEAFGGVFTKLNELLNSDMAQQFINNFVGAIYLAGDAMENFIDFCVAAWPMISPFIWAAVAAVGAYALVLGISNGLALISSARTAAQAVGVGLYAVALWATTGATWGAVTAELGLTQAQLGANAAMYACPLVWIVGIILVLIAALYAGVAAFNKFSGSSVSATGIIVGAISVLVAIVNNKITFIWNLFADLANFVCNCFNDVPSAVSILFYDMAITVLGYIESIAKGIQNLINAIPGVEVNIVGGLGNLKSGLEKNVAGIKDASGWKEYVKKREYKDLATAYGSGYDFGSGFAGKASNLFGGFAPGDYGGAGDQVSVPSYDASGGIGSGGNPATVKGTGNGGAVKVENDDDIEWMRKLAERDYVARISQNTLAPNIKVEFTGPITKEADVDGVAAHLGELLKEQIAIAPEGVYV